MPPKKAAAAPAAAAPKPKPKAAPKKEKKTEEPRPEDLIEKVPEPDAAVFEARIQEATAEVEKLQSKQQALNKRITERSGGRDEFTERRNALRHEIDKWTSEMDKLKARREEIQKAMGQKKEEGVQARNDLTKLQKSVGYSSEQDIDQRIADIEFKLWTESVPLKQEKELLKEIQELKRNRPKVAKVNELKHNIASDDKGKDLKEQLKDIGVEMGVVFGERQKVSEQLKQLNEERQGKMGDLPDLINQRDELSKQIQEKIKDRNAIKTEKKLADDAYYKYKAEIRKIKQERAQEDRIKRQKEYEERRKQKEADKLDEQPYVQEIALVEQCMAFCKSLTQEKGKVVKEEKKEVSYDLPKGAEILVKKDDREEFYFEPTARGKKGKSKPKKEENNSSKPIKHNAETFNLFDKLKLDAPITTDDVPALMEKLEAKLEDYNNLVKEWEQKREDLKQRILAGQSVDDAEGEKEDDKEEAEEKEEEKDEEKEEEEKEADEQ